MQKKILVIGRFYLKEPSCHRKQKFINRIGKCIKKWIYYLIIFLNKFSKNSYFNNFEKLNKLTEISAPIFSLLSKIVPLLLLFTSYRAESLLSFAMRWGKVAMLGTIWRVECRSWRVSLFEVHSHVCLRWMRLIFHTSTLSRCSFLII